MSVDRLAETMTGAIASTVSPESVLKVTLGSRTKRSSGYPVDAPGRNPHEEYAFIRAEWAQWRECRGFMRPLKALRPTARF